MATTSPSPRWTSPRRRTALLVLAAVLWLVPAVFYTSRLWGRSFDDFYITYRYAQNLALGRGFVFNPGERVFGTTAPGFGLALGLLSRLTGIAIPGLGTTATGLSLLAIALLLLNGTRDRWPEALAGGTLLLTCSFVWTQHGSEVPASLALLLGAAALAGPRPLVAGLFAGLAVWLRPDAVLGVGVLGLLLSWERRRLPWIYGLTAGTVIAAGLVAARLWFGRFLPLTLEAKRLQAVIRPQTWQAGWDFWEAALTHVRNLYAGDRTFPLLLAGTLGLWPLLRHGGRPGRLLALNALAVAIAYPLLGVPAYTWYPIPVVIALLYGATFLAGALGRRLTHRRDPNGREAGSGGPAQATGRAGGEGGGAHPKEPSTAPRTRRAAAALALATLLLLPLFLPILHRTLESARRPVITPRHTLYQRTASWLRAHSTPTDEIAYVEVGTLAYFADRPIRDLLGLVTPESLPHVARGDLLGALRARPTTFFVYHHRIRGLSEPIVQHRWFRRRYREAHREQMRTKDEWLIVYRRKPPRFLEARPRPRAAHLE